MKTLSDFDFIFQNRSQDGTYGVDLHEDKMLI